MDAPFTIYIVNTRRKAIFLFAKILVLLFSAFSIFNAITLNKIGPYIYTALLIVACILCFTTFKRNNLFIALAIIFCAIPLAKYNYLISPIILFLAYMFYSSAGYWVFSFTTEKIILKTGITKIVHWAELQQINWRDNLLTLDFKNNKIIQESIDETLTTCNKQNFLQFCSRQIT